MSAKFANSLKTFLAASVIQSLRQQQPPDWVPNTFYQLSTQVSNQGRIYAASTNGTTGPAGPTHQIGVYQDGSVRWLYISSSAAQGEINSGLYLGVAKNTVWKNESLPDTAKTSSASETLALSELLTLVKVTANNTRLGIKRNNWTTGTLYSQFDSNKDTDEYTTPFFVVTPDRNIYKCIENNNGAVSTSLPTGTNVGTIRLADKYVWKYMGSFSSADDSEFGTTDYIPVSQKLVNDESPQWATQEAARAGSISAFAGVRTDGIAFASAPVCSFVSSTGFGASASLDLTVSNQAQSFVLLNPGVGYDTDTIVIGYVGSNAQGSNCRASGVFTSGVLTSITIENNGNGYEGGISALVLGDGTGAVVVPTVLGGTVTGFTIVSGGTGYTSAKIVVFPVAAGVAAAKAIMAPKQGHGKNILTELGCDVILMSFKITSALAPYIQETTFRRLALIAGPAGLPANAEVYTGPAHPDYETGILHKYRANTGSLTFVNNIVAISHTSDQEETIKLAIKF